MVNKSDKDNIRDFEKLYDKYVKKIYNFIYYKTHHRETAEDLTSETFMKALSNIEKYDENKGLFSTWLYQIARNTVIDFYRTKKSNLNIDDIWDLVGKEDIIRDFDTAEKLKKVESYLKDLRSDQREIIIMRVWDGRSYKEIAEIMGKSEASCKMMFLRTIKTLRKEMPLSILISMLLF